MPSDRIGAQSMTEKASDVSESVRFISVDRIVVFCEGLLEEVGPESVDLSKPLTDETVELRVGLFLRATLNDHRR